MSDIVYDSNTVSAIFGGRNAGKTQYLRGNPKFNLPGFFNLYLERDMKVLIVDTIDHPSYRDIPIIKPEQFSNWKKGVYRIYLNKRFMDELIEHINNTIWNAFLVFEDAYKHQKKKLSDPLMDLIGDSKQQNIDMVFMYHCWSLAPKDLFRYLDKIQCFKTKDHPLCRKDDMTGYYEEALSVYTEVLNHPSPHYSKLITTDL